MKAMFRDGYGPVIEVLHLRDVPGPAVGDDEVLVRVRAASVHPDTPYNRTPLSCVFQP